MSNTVNNINLITDILSNQAVQGILIGAFFNAVQFFLSIKNTKDKQLKWELLTTAVSKSSTLVTAELDNDAKRKAVVDYLYNFVPANIKHTISQDMLEKISDQAYHTFVKPQS